MLREIVRRLGHLGRTSQFERELDEEIRFHIEARAGELERSGLRRADAEAQARREFGSRARSNEDTRSAWQFRWIEEAGADLRYAVRSLRRSPAFALTAIACLALGIGANVLIFSLVDAVLLRSLSFPEPDRLVTIWFIPPNQSGQKAGTNALAYVTLRDHNRSFEYLGAARLDAAFNVGDDSPGAAPPERIRAQWFTVDLVRGLGVNPVLGRWPNGRGEDSGVVISYGLWQHLFGGATDVIGKQLRTDLTQTPLAILDVTPAGFELLNPDAGLWVFQSDQNLRSGAYRSSNRIFTLIGRLKPGVTLDQAQADLNSLMPSLVQEMPDMNRGWSIRLEKLHDTYVGQIRKPLMIFQGAVFLVLLIACANVAGLQLAQASLRQKELSMRAALGSSRGRIIRQLLTESALLSVLGGGVGLALAWGGLRLFVNLSPGGFPRLGAIGLNPTVLGSTLLLCLISGVVFGTVPAIQISRPDLMDVLREAARGSTAGGTPEKLRGVFVVAQVSLALVLLVGAGLLVHSWLRLNMVQPGIDPRRLITFQVPFPRSLYNASGSSTPAGGFQADLNPRIHLLSEQIRARLALVPGVESAALAVTPPLGGVPRRMDFQKEGQVVAPGQQDNWSAEWYPIGLDYFRTLRIPLLAGRDFRPEDKDTGAPVVMISSAMAQQYWPHENPVGQRIQMNLLYDPPREIVGVVGDVRQDRYQHDPQPQLYVPRAQLPLKMDLALSQAIMLTNTFIVRTKADPAQLASALRSAVAEVDRTQAVTNVRTVEEYAGGQLQDLREYVALLSVFGGISVALAVIGLFGMMAHAVSQRTNEIGIRMALGAPPATVLGLMLRQGLVVTAAGLVIGLGASLILTRVIQSFLWGVTATDPLTFALVGCGLAVIALLACYLPARRALHIDPVIALRSE